MQQMSFIHYLDTECRMHLTVSASVHCCCYCYYRCCCCCNTGQILRHTGADSSVRQLPGRLLLPQRRHDCYPYNRHQHSHLQLRRLHIKRLELRRSAVPSWQLLPYRLPHTTALLRWELHEPHCCCSVRPLPCQLSVCRVRDDYTTSLPSGVILSCEHRACASEMPCRDVWCCCWAGCYWRLHALHCWQLLQHCGELFCTVCDVTLMLLQYVCLCVRTGVVLCSESVDVDDASLRPLLVLYRHRCTDIVR
jgi:hypothetical protein